ncbi:DUF5677 domain-containing protein [Flavobacterium channae]|uniref:DUF5677 domain-containing protein n=1 Tax=Flavobacterium channae TaxID=2897181 RepID=UPI001E536102|nr:DUF5677 domain-containing protein [Flavobacterium channae]UGS24448.1 DUF5677 domain-containing protein [Flavobacterium channae]
MMITEKHIIIVEKQLDGIENLEDYINNSKYPKVLSATLNFIEKIKALQSDIQNIKSNYTANCLLRTIVEHFLVSYYIFYRFHLDNNDDVGKKYYTDYFVTECFKKDMYQLGVDGMLTGEANNATFENLKKKLSPDFDDLTQTEYDNFNREGKQFDIKKIQNFLIKNPLPDNHFNKVNKELIPILLGKYNTLSSYIHGGPNAEMEFKRNKYDLSDGKEWSSIVLFFTITNFFMMLISIDRKFENLKDYISLESQNYK